MIYTLKVGLVQFNASSDKISNLARALVYVNQAIDLGAQFVLLPETFNQRGPQTLIREGAEGLQEGPSVKPFLELAKTRGVTLLLNICQALPENQDKLYNTSLLIHPEGTIAAQYNKIHLFDVDVGEKKFRESDLFLAGDTPVIGTVLGIKTGLSICYDLRFPELYRYYATHGAKLLCIPASFTYPTGKAHWEPLLRARAIENQCFVLAPGQTGIGANGVQTYGNSMVIDPWGTVLSRGTETQEEVLVTDLDLYGQEKLRREFPVLSHMRMAPRLG